MSSKTAKKKSDEIKDDIAIVRIVSRVGQIVLRPDDKEWINPTTSRTVKGITLFFADSGVCELHPVKDAEIIKEYRDWIAEDRDPRIVDTGVFEIAADALIAPFAKWNVTETSSIVSLVDTLGLDVEHCLRYELHRGKDSRKKLVEALEKKIDAPAPEADPLEEPEL